MEEGEPDTQTLHQPHSSYCPLRSAFFAPFSVTGESMSCYKRRQRHDIWIKKSTTRSAVFDRAHINVMKTLTTKSGQTVGIPFNYEL